MEKIIEIIEKEFITEEELRKLEENVDVEYNGYSNRSDRFDYYWYTVTVDGEEYSVYTK